MTASVRARWGGESGGDYDRHVTRLERQVLSDWTTITDDVTVYFFLQRNRGQNGVASAMEGKEGKKREQQQAIVNFEMVVFRFRLIRSPNLTNNRIPVSPFVSQGEKKRRTNLCIFCE